MNHIALFLDRLGQNSIFKAHFLRPWHTALEIDCNQTIFGRSFYVSLSD